MNSSERQLEAELISRLGELKYVHRPDLRDRLSLEQNFRDKFQALNHVRLADGEFQRLLDEIVTPDVFTAAHTLRNRNSFTRDDGTPLNFTLVNIHDWCKNDFEVINELPINSDYSHHRYDVLLLINGVPVVQIELKTLGINPRRAIEQIVDYKNDPGNGYTRTLLCFVQLFIVSNRDSTWYFANNNARHFAFNADERFLPIYRHAGDIGRQPAPMHAVSIDLQSATILAVILQMARVALTEPQTHSCSPGRNERSVLVDHLRACERSNLARLVRARGKWSETIP